jgi:hypothetical protein
LQRGHSSIGPCSTFFSNSGDAGAGTYGVGLSVLNVNDTIAAEIGSACVGVEFVSELDGGISISAGGDAGSSQSCDWVAFAVCAKTIAQQRTQPSACRPDAG